MTSQIIELIKKNRLSDLKSFLLENDKYKKSIQLKEILGLIELSLGNISESLNYFEKENSETFYSFVSNELRLTYVPKFNVLLDKIKNNENIQEEELYLENTLPNVELYIILSLYYIKNKERKKAQEYISKGLLIDSRNQSLLELKKISEKNKSRLILVGSIGIFICVLSLISNNYLKQMSTIKNEYNNLQIRLNFEVEKNKLLSTTINNIKSPEVKPEEFKFLLNDFDEKELYLKAKKFRKNKVYDKSIEYYEYVLNSNGNSIYTREALFWYARTLEDSGKYLQALENFRLYLEKYRDTDVYITETEARIKKIILN